MCFRQQTVRACERTMGKERVVTQRFPSSEHLKDRGVPIPGVFQVCEHEGVSSMSSSSRSVFVKKTIADLLQTDHSLHEHLDSGGW